MPTLITETEESAAYEKQYINLQFTQFKFDPTLSCEYRLSTSAMKLADAIWLLAE